MLLLNPADPHSLYKMDLTVGKVVEEWKVHDDVPVAHITPDSKFAQETARQTLIGASSKGLFRIDPRMSGNKLVDGEFKQYVTKAAFSGLATTEAGHLAVASEKGDIRLFDSIGKNAKTALPALGDPIIGVDVTASGRWIVATCETHIYVIDTLITEGRYKEKLGFERSFPANARPTPKRLQLKPEHVMYMGSEPSFTPARSAARFPLLNIQGLSRAVADLTSALIKTKRRSSRRQVTILLHGTSRRSRRESWIVMRSESSSSSFFTSFSSTLMNIVHD